MGGVDPTLPERLWETARPPPPQPSMTEEMIQLASPQPRSLAHYPCLLATLKGRGHGLVAARDLEAGEVVLRSERMGHAIRMKHEQVPCVCRHAATLVPSLVRACCTRAHRHTPRAYACMHTRACIRTHAHARSQYWCVECLRHRLPSWSPPLPVACQVNGRVRVREGEGEGEGEGARKARARMMEREREDREGERGQEQASDAQTLVHAHMHTHIHSRTRAHTHTHSHTWSHTHTYAHTCTHTHPRARSHSLHMTNTWTSCTQRTGL